jgi:type IV pilus assembly protein PilM
VKHRVNGINRVGLVNSDGHVIGLDIGATAVRAAVLAPGMHEGRPSVTVHGLGSVPLPAGAVDHGAVSNPLAVTAAIKEMWRVNKLNDRKVVLGIASQQVVVRDLVMPDLPPQQLRAALPYQAREVIAIPVDQALIDFCPIGPADPSTNGVPGLLIAAPRKPVLTAVEAVEKAGLQVARVDLAAFAALRSTASPFGGVELIVDLGAQLASVVIHQNGVPKVVRVVSHGSDEITDRLADRVGISVEEAETIKRTVGITGDTEAARVIRDILRPLFSEIRGSLHFYSTGSPGAPVERIGLTGGGAGLPGLAQTLADQHGVSAGVIAPMQHIRNRYSTKDVDHTVSEQSASAVSVGLAMGAAA